MTLFSQFDNWLKKWGDTQKLLFNSYIRLYFESFATEEEKNKIRAKDGAKATADGAAPREVTAEEFFLKSADFYENPLVGRAVNVKEGDLEYANWRMRIPKENDLTLYVEEIIGIIHENLRTGLEQANRRVERIYRDHLNEPTSLFLEEFVTWLTTNVAPVDCKSPEDLGKLENELKNRISYLQKVKSMKFYTLQAQAGQRNIKDFFYLVEIILENINKILEFTKIAQSRITAVKNFEELSTKLNFAVKKTFEYLFYSGINRSTSSDGFTFKTLTQMESRNTLETFVSRLLLHMAKIIMPNYLPRNSQTVANQQNFTLRNLQAEVKAIFEWWPTDANKAEAWGILPQQATESYKEFYLNVILSFLQLVATQKIATIIARITGHGGNIMTYGLAGQLLSILINKLMGSLIKLENNLKLLHEHNSSIHGTYLGKPKNEIPAWAYTFDNAQLIFEQLNQYLQSCQERMEAIQQAIKEYNLVDEMNNLRHDVHDLIEYAAEFMVIRGDPSFYIEQWRILGNDLIGSIPLVQQVKSIKIADTPPVPTTMEEIQQAKEKEHKENLALVKQIDPFILLPFATKYLSIERSRRRTWREPAKPSNINDMLHLKFEEILLMCLTMEGDRDSEILLPALALRKRNLDDFEGTADIYSKILNKTPSSSNEILLGYAKSLSNILSGFLAMSTISNMDRFNQYLGQYIATIEKLDHVTNLTPMQQTLVKQLHDNLEAFRNGFAKYVTVGERLRALPSPPSPKNQFGEHA